MSMSAKILFLLGAAAFWLPEIILYTWNRPGLHGVVTVLLPSTLLLIYIMVLTTRPNSSSPKPSAALFMLLGVIFLGTLAMTIGATERGAGFSVHPISTLLGVLLGTVIPIYAFVAAAYDGSLYALVLVSVLMPILHLIVEKPSWIIPLNEVLAFCVTKIEQLRTTDADKRKPRLSECQFPVESVAERSPKLTKFNRQNSKIKSHKRTKNLKKIDISTRFWPTNRERCNLLKIIIDHFSTRGQNRLHRALENA